MSARVAPRDHRYLSKREVALLRAARRRPARPAAASITRGERGLNPLRAGDGGAFYEHRRYTPGEDASRIDWKLYARTDRLYLRRDERRGDRPLLVLVDASASMAFAGFEPAAKAQPSAWASWRDALAFAIQGPPDAEPRHASPADQAVTKYDHAAKLAAASAWLARDRRRPWRVAWAGPEPPRPCGDRDGLPALLARLEARRSTLGGRADLARATRSIGRDSSSPRATDLLVITDPFEPRGPTVAALRRWRAAHGRAAVAQVLHPHEVGDSDPFAGSARLVDAEAAAVRPWRGEGLAHAYAGGVRREVAAWRSALSRAGVGYQTFAVDRAYHRELDGLLRFLDRPGR